MLNNAGTIIVVFADAVQELLGNGGIQLLLSWMHATS